MPGIFSQYDSQDLNRLAAKGILEKLRNIRQRINEDFTARRLLWELIQNAKDNAFTCNLNGNSNVKIEIELEPNQLSFFHNKGFFTNENIRGLIRRYSSSEKDRETDLSALPPSTTGRFGTGFMTTHLLSERVYVSGFFQENDRVFKKFELPLDRTGKTEKDIIQSIERAFNAVEESINKSDISDISLSDKFKTLFRYSLDDKGYELASISISEFDECIAFTLINIPTIEKVTVKQNGEIRFYAINKINEYDVENLKIEIIEVKSNNHNVINKHFATIYEENTRIVIPIKYSEEIVEILYPEKNIPRLFLDFPMIGTEGLNIPFIINNPFFEPTESRDGVSLTGGTDNDTITNSNILIKAFELYKVFVEFATQQNNWTNLYNLARVKKPPEKEWLSQEWYSKTIIGPIREYLLKAKIVDTVKGDRVSIVFEDGGNVDFPFHSKKEMREKIWELCNIDEYYILPLKEHIHDWHEIVWDKHYHLDLETIISWTSNLKNLEALKEYLNTKEISPVEWLNNLYKLASQDENSLISITQNKTQIIPNQLGQFCFLKDLSIDNNIDGQLKEVLQILNDDIRIKLCHNDVNTLTETTNEHFWYFPSETNQDNVVEHINRIIKDGKNDNISKACDYLISLFSTDENFSLEKRNSIFEFCKTVWPEDHMERREISVWTESIWIEADKCEIKWIVNSISEDINIETSFKNLNFSDCRDYLKWLNEFVSFLNKNDFGNLLNLKTIPILPNQKGIYCIKDDLFLDDGLIDENLKDIAGELGYDVKGELLSKEIFIELPESRVKNQEQLAEEISKLIRPVLKDLTGREEKKATIRKLYLWMNKNSKIAEKIFREVYEKRFLLISDEEITANIEKAEILDEIIGETGLSPKEIKDKLIAILNNPRISKFLESTKNDDVELYPAGSEEDILISPSLIDGSSEKSRISISEEAKDNIFQTLRNKGFTVPSSIRINFTIVDGIISPTGKPIRIVVKSGKAGRIYFNPSEWLALTEEDSQLFVMTRGNAVRNVTLADIESINDIFHMRFNTRSFALTNLKAFANFFKYLPYTHFIFETPESTSDYLMQFGLSERNPSSSELTADDKNLLH